MVEGGTSPAPVAGQTVSQPPTRPPETQDWLNRNLFHPLARRLAAALAPTGVSPNMVSFAGFLMIAAAAFAYVGLPWPAAFLIGFPLHLLWHVLDGADGDLARMTGKSSSVGELVDGVCDYAGHVLLYVLFAIMLDDSLGLWAWALCAAAGAGRIVQSNFSESQRRIYLWRAYDVPWLQQNARTVKADRGLFVRVFGIFVDGYVALAQSGSHYGRRIDARLEALPMGSPERARAQAIVKAEAAPLLPFVAMLGQNPRTVLLGLSMALGSPVYFLVAEFTLLSAVLLAAMRRERQVSRRVLERLDREFGQAAAPGNA